MTTTPCPSPLPREFTVLGITDDHDTCDCCGRTNLKRTVALRDSGGEVGFYGTTCAALLLRREAKDVRREAREAQDRIEEATRAEKQRASQAELERWTAFLRQRSGINADVATMIRALGGFASARSAYREAFPS